MVSLRRTNYLKAYRTYFQIHRVVLILAVTLTLLQLPHVFAQPTKFGCESRHDIPGPGPNPLDPIEMNTIVIPFEFPLVKTIHLEKEVFLCQQEAAPYNVIVDVSIYTEIVENAIREEPVQKSFEVVTCMKNFNGTILSCMSEQPPTNVPALPCVIEPAPRPEFLHFPIEMNSVVVNSTIVKTIMAETEVFNCPNPYSLSHNISKLVTLFTDKFEKFNDIEPQPTIEKANHFESAECVKDEISAEVLGCTFRAVG